MRPALLAVAHGSSDPRSVASLRALTDRVATGSPGLPVRLALLDHAAEHGLDDVATSLARMAEMAARPRSVVAVPLLLNEAYHARVDLPAVLAAARDAHPGLHIEQAPVLGPHPLLASATARRLREAGVHAADPDTAVVLAAAGSSAPDAVASMHNDAWWWSRSGWWAARAAFASAAGPTVGEAVSELRAAGAPRVVVASYLLAPGRLPERVRAQAEHAGAYLVSEPLSDAPEVARLVRTRYDETLARTAAPMAGAA